MAAMGILVVFGFGVNNVYGQNLPNSVLTEGNGSLDTEQINDVEYNYFFGKIPSDHEIIATYGKPSEFGSKEQRQNWFSSLDELGDNLRFELFPNYMYPNGKVLSCGENSRGYFVIVFHRNLTIEKPLVDEIYAIIDENAKSMGIEEIPVEFSSGIYRLNEDDIDFLANLRENEITDLGTFMKSDKGYRPRVIGTYGKLPELKTEEESWKWFYQDLPAITRNTRNQTFPYFSDGMLTEVGVYRNGYISVTVYENLTIDKQLLMDEIYGIYNEEAKKRGIQEVPVVFVEGGFAQLDALVEDEEHLSGEASNKPVSGFGLLSGLICLASGWLLRKE